MAFDVVTDTGALNQALFSVTHGLYILTAFEGKQNGQCLDALMQVTNMPPKVAIGVGKKSLTNEMIEKTGRFVINVLDREDPKVYDMVKHFGFQSGRNVDKFNDVDFPFHLGELGIAILDNSKAFYECEVDREKCLDLKTHTLFTGPVLRAGTRSEGEPLTYNEYRKVMKKK